MTIYYKLVCYTYFHWFLNPECQHIFGKQTGYIFQSPKSIKTWTTKYYASLNQWYNIKCCFYTQNGCMNKIILQRLIPSQIPDRFSKLLCSRLWNKTITYLLTITNKQNVEPWKLSTSWGHTKVLFTCRLHLYYWNCFPNPLFCYVIY